MASEGEVKFILGDTLPTYYDAAISIFSSASKPNSAKMKKAINSYTNSLIEMWEKAFTTETVNLTCRIMKESSQSFLRLCSHLN